MVDRSQLPALIEDAPFTFPPIRKKRLANGLDLWVVEHRAVPVVTSVLLLRAGSSADPADRPGLASLTGDLLDEGAGDRSALAVHEVLAGIGAQFDTEVGPDATFLTLTSLARFRPKAFELLSDLVVRPRFDPSEFARVRQLRTNRLRQLNDVPSALADRGFIRALFGSHPYGHLAIGTLTALAAVDLGEVVRFHAQAYAPSRATLVVVGDVDADQVLDDADAAFGDWAVTADEADISRVLAAVETEPPDPAGRLWLVDRPGAPQSELRIGHLGVSRQTPDYHALLVLNLVLGGQFVSRLNMNLRERKGYTYGVRSWFEFRRGRGPFQVQASVQTGATADAIREAWQEVSNVRGDVPITDSELDMARAVLTRGYPRNFETADQVARSVAQLALYDLPDDYFSQFVPRIAGLTATEVMDAAHRHLDAGRLLTLVVGDGSAIGDGLTGLGLGDARLTDPGA